MALAWLAVAGPARDVMSGVTWLDAHIEEILLAAHLEQDGKERELVQALRDDVRNRIRGAVGQLAIEIAGGRTVIGTSDLERITDECMADDSYTIQFD